MLESGPKMSYELLSSKRKTLFWEFKETADISVCTDFGQCEQDIGPNLDKLGPLELSAFRTEDNW